MECTLVALAVEVRLVADGGGHGGALEALPDDLDGQGRRVRHIGIIEAVVAELVEEELIGREIGRHSLGRGLLLGALAAARGGGRQRLHELVDGQQEGALAELVVVGAVAEMTYGGDGEEDVEGGEAGVELVEQGAPEAHDVVYRHAAADEAVGVYLVAVGYGLTAEGLLLSSCVGLQAVGPGGAEGEEEEAGLLEGLVGLVETAVAGGEAFLGGGT